MEKHQNSTIAPQKPILSAAYWQDAARLLGSTRILAVAALIVALRVAVKAISIPIVTGVSLTFDCYVNALGSLIYGPVVGLLVGAVSDTIGCLLFPSGVYFFPFIFVEMSSSFIFALFLWRRELSVGRVFLSKLTVNLVSNVIITSLFMKWMYYWLGDAKAVTYKVINTVRIAKNLVLLPLETVLLSLFIGLMLPVLPHIGIKLERQPSLRPERRHFLLLAALFLLSAAAVAAYYFIVVLK